MFSTQESYLEDRQTEVQRLNSCGKWTLDGKKTQRIQCSSSSANKILSFILKLILVLHSTEKYVPFNTKSWNSLRDQEGAVCLTRSFDISLDLRLNSWYGFIPSPGNRPEKWNHCPELVRESQDWNPSFWTAESLLYDKTTLTSPERTI